MTPGAVVLLVLGATVLLVAMGFRRHGWRSQDQQPVSLPVPRGPHHLHYCTACDRQWEHAGASHECTKYWAAICPVCSPA